MDACILLLPGAPRQVPLMQSSTCKSSNHSCMHVHACHYYTHIFKHTSMYSFIYMMVVHIIMMLSQAKSHFKSVISISYCALALSPGLSQRGEKGLVHAHCACASLYPESEYIVYSCKIFSKLSI